MGTIPFDLEGWKRKAEATIARLEKEVERLSELEQACKALVANEDAFLLNNPPEAKEQGFVDAWLRMLDALKGGTA